MALFGSSRGGSSPDGSSGGGPHDPGAARGGSGDQPGRRGRRHRPPRPAVRAVPASAFDVPGRPSTDGVAPRRRDRRGRGIRGPLLPPGSPAHRTRAQRFDDHVLDAVERLERAWGSQLAGAEFAVEDVPPSDPAPWESGGVPLGRYFPAEAGQPARIVVYRRPVETRALDDEDAADLVRDVVVEQVAHMLARTPEEIDPGYGGD